MCNTFEQKRFKFNKKSIAFYAFLLTQNKCSDII